jgi:hypothetical protein
MMGSEGPVVQADGTWYSERRIRSGHSDRGGLDRSRRPGRSSAPGRYSPALNRLRRLSGDCRTSEIELIAGDPDAMHDHGKLACQATSGTGPSYCLTGGCYRDLS